jgi:alpha-glucoside transport system permease protein
MNAPNTLNGVSAAWGTANTGSSGGARSTRGRRRRSGGRGTRVLRRANRLLSRAAVQLLLAVVGVAWLVPTLGLAVSSLRGPADISGSGWWTVVAKPSELTLTSYRALLDDPRMVQAFGNTVAITVPATILVVLLAAMAGYAFASVAFRGRDALFLVVVCLLVVPLQVALIPVARLFGAIGLFGKVPAAVLFHVAFGLPFAIFLLRNFFIGIPQELLEAARIDGAGELTIFLRVVLPLALPAIASLAIFQFLWVWNDLLVALVFTSPRSAPLNVFIQNQTRQFGSNFDVIAPGAFLSTLVPLMVFFAFQRYFVQGILAGSTK